MERKIVLEPIPEGWPATPWRWPETWPEAESVTREVAELEYRVRRKLSRYDYEPGEFDARAQALAESRVDLSPAELVNVARRVTLPCRRCAQTGKFITRVENGIPKGPGGACFRCNGKGYQTAEDWWRNGVHDVHYVPAGM